MSDVPDFDGETYERERDHDRLAHQMGRVQAFMRDGEWHDSVEIAEGLGENWASLSARVRDLRKPKFGGWIVERRYVADGVWAYRMSPRSDQPSPNLAPIPVPVAPVSPLREGAVPEHVVHHTCSASEGRPPNEVKCGRRVTDVKPDPFAPNYLTGYCTRHHWVPVGRA